MSEDKACRDLLDDDGENRAVRAFLQLYGGMASVTTHQMRYHLGEVGFGRWCWPDWTTRDVHLTKGGAQDWLRHLFALEGRAAKPAVPEVLFDGYAVLQAMSEKAKARTSPENVSDVLDAAVKLIRAAPPLPVAQGVPDIGAIWEQAICEVEAGIKLAELRPNQIPGLFQILRRNVEAKLAAAPPEPPTIETLIERANATLGEFEVPKEPTCK